MNGGRIHHEVVTLRLSDIIPYKNNPRKNDDAVEPLAQSMKLSGYDQYILVDEENIILKGHTRRKALLYLSEHQELGKGRLEEITADSIKVIRVHGLTPKEKKTARIYDNKVGELATWDYDLLGIETADIGISPEALGFGEDIDFGNLNSMMGGKDEEYQEFEDKFKPKFTTDDCFTPPAVYEAIKSWVFQQYGERETVVRPFYPGGDYTKEVYPKGCIVIDNPPFSIAAEINRFFNEHGIDFFLFANHLTCFNNLRPGTNIVLTQAGIEYDNGAIVSTSFYTNLGDAKVHISASLREAIDEAQPNHAAELKSYKYPENIQTSASLGRLAGYGSEFKIYNLEATKGLDDGTDIFGKGIMVSDIMAEKIKTEKENAERRKMEKRLEGEQKLSAKIENGRIMVKLSDRERAIIAGLNTKDESRVEP